LQPLKTKENKVNIELQKQSDLNATVLVKLQPEDYNPKVETQLKKIQKTANIKGFRVGHAPMGMLKRNYGKSVLVEEVNQLASSSLFEYLKSENIDILAQPLASSEVLSELDFEKEGADFLYAFDIAMTPDFELNINNKDVVTRYVINVDEAEVEKEIANLQKRNGKLIDVENADDNDIIYATATELNDNSIYFEGGQLDKPISFVSEMIKDQKTKDLVIGCKVGDEIKVNIYQLFNENIAVISNTLGISKDEANDLNADFSLKISEIKRNEVSVLDQSFFDTILGPNAAANESEFREKIKENLELYFKSESENLLERSINDLINDNHNFNLPDDFLKRWLLESKPEEYNQENIDERYAKEAKGLTYVLVQEKLTKLNSFEVKKEDLEQTSLGYTAQMFRQYGISNPDFTMLKDYSDKQLKDPNYIQNMMDIALKKMMINKLKEVVSISEETIGVEAFYQKINEHKNAQE